MLSVREVFYLSGSQKCQSCSNIFPKEFAGRGLGWYGGDEEYSEQELIECFGLNWKNRDTKGQWFLWKKDFLCPECARKLIDSGEAKLVTCLHKYFTTSNINELPEDKRKYAKVHVWDKSFGRSPSGCDVEISYEVLVKTRKKTKQMDTI